MSRRRSFLITVFTLTFSLCSCDQLQQPKLKQENDLDLHLTLGGFREGHPDDGTLDGVCTLNISRTAMDCDVYNGISGWIVTEVTLVVTWSPYTHNDKRFYSERVSIAPLKTERISIKLGLQLPPDDQLRNKRSAPIGPPLQHWEWSLVGAKGHQFQ